MSSDQCDLRPLPSCSPPDAMETDVGGDELAGRRPSARPVASPGSAHAHDQGLGHGSQQGYSSFSLEDPRARPFAMDDLDAQDASHVLGDASGLSTGFLAPLTPTTHDLGRSSSSVGEHQHFAPRRTTWDLPATPSDSDRRSFSSSAASPLGGLATSTVSSRDSPAAHDSGLGLHGVGPTYGFYTEQPSGSSERFDSRGQPFDGASTPGFASRQSHSSLLRLALSEPG